MPNTGFGAMRVGLIPESNDNTRKGSEDAKVRAASTLFVESVSILVGLSEHQF